MLERHALHDNSATIQGATRALALPPLAQSPFTQLAADLFPFDNWSILVAQMTGS